MLRCVAVCRSPQLKKYTLSVLQCVAVCCSVLLCVAALDFKGTHWSDVCVSEWVSGWEGGWLAGSKI